MEFRKIKYDGKVVTIRWSTRKGTTEVAHELTSRERPAPALIEALAAFVHPVLELLQLPPEYADGFSVIGLSLNVEEGDDRGGVVITCFKTLAGANSPLVLNTPHLREQADEEEGGKFMPDEWLDLIAAARGAATQYIGGEREQTTLFAEANA